MSKDMPQILEIKVGYQSLKEECLMTTYSSKEKNRTLKDYYILRNKRSQGA